MEQTGGGAALPQACQPPGHGVGNTSAPCGDTVEHTRRSLQDAVWCYRNAYRGERLCNRLKRRVHIAPLCVTLHEHIEGLTYLLTLGVRG
jgi:transposase